MITIDQAKIDAPKFPRSQEWWAGFVPMWVTATVRDDGTVALEVAPKDHPSQTPGRVSRRKQAAALAQWVERLPRIAVAIVPESAAVAAGEGETQ